jgi:malonyl-ACP O-methyltransferase BioC
MIATIDKDRVRLRFKKGLRTYGQHATVQRRMGSNLLEIVRREIGARFDRVLEIGSGAGLLTELIHRRLEVGTFFANDLLTEAEPYVLRAFPGARFIPGDAEMMEGFPKHLDLVISNAAFQWLTDAGAFLHSIHGLIRPGGSLVFSSFGPGNLAEISELLHVGLPYRDCEELEALCGWGFETVYGKEETVVLHFPNAHAVLKHMQGLGVNGIRKHSWSKASLRDLEDRYHRGYGSEQGLPLTYRPLYLALRRR